MPKQILAAVLAMALFGAGAMPASGQPVPNPLSLEQALAYAGEHPRTRLEPGQEAPSTGAPLYLNCHQLAFGGNDDARNRVRTDLVGPEAAQQLRILERFFDVLLADLSYSRHNEALAVAYILFDRARARQELGQFSELTVAELEADYQNVLRERVASEVSQRLTRGLLAQALGQPGALPRDLVEPPLPEVPAAMPPAAEVAQTAAAGNAWLQTRKTGNDARERLIDMEAEQQALELLLRLESLAAVERYARTDSFLRDLKLDESRTLYEQEVRADLGFSMSQQTRARLREQQVGYCRALTLGELAALQGKPVWPPATMEQ